VIIVRIPTRVDILQQLNLIQRLIEEIFRVFNNFQTNQRIIRIFRSLQIDALERAGKGRLSQQLLNLVAPGHDESRGGVEVLLLFETRAEGFKYDLEYNK
jgi:hypothetical protein